MVRLKPEAHHGTRLLPPGSDQVQSIAGEEARTERRSQVGLAAEQTWRDKDDLIG